MKFGKMIQRLGRELPDKLFLRYKNLKKLLKLVKKVQGQPAKETESGEIETTKSEEIEKKPRMGTLSAEETEFIKELNKELSELNNFFIDAEEKVVIRLQALEAQLNQVQDDKNQDDTQALKAAFIDFHGEIVLLLHWGLLNFAAVTKILKKHDKQTGLPLRAPYLEAVLKQPFYSTDLLGRLAKRVADIVEQLVDPNEHMNSPNPKPRSYAESQSVTVRDKVRMTRMALGTWQELGNNASTPSTVLPTKLIESMEASSAGDEEQLSSSDVDGASLSMEVTTSEPVNRAETCTRKRSAACLEHQVECEGQLKRKR